MCVQGLEVELDEHRGTASMFQQATKYNIQMTNILVRFFDLEIKKQTYHRGKRQICSKVLRSFGEGAKAQSKIAGEVE